MGTTAALIVAAGRGSRFGSELPKQYCALGDEPMLRRTIRHFLDHAEIGAVRAVIHPDDRALYDEAVSGLDLLDPVNGGAERQDSVRLGLESLSDLGPDRVLIHDAARPFVDDALITRVIDALDGSPGAIPALAVSDTVKREDDGFVAGTVDRSGLWRAQTPQGFRYADILNAHRDLTGRDLTDDSAVAETAGLGVAIVEGDEANFKVTTEDDLVRAAKLVLGRLVRTGIGFDVHRFGQGDHVMLCGVEIPHTAGLEGHSDADVGLHAVTDALLGAIAAGDIGSHFPPTDPAWRNASSDTFLAHARDLARENGGRVVSIDVTLICESPKIGPFRGAMRERIAGILDIPLERVNVKATTTERLGFTGRGEGIAAQAVASVAI